MSELAEELENIGQVYRTGRLYVEYLIMPVMIIHLYLRAERTRHWLLLYVCTEANDSIFFAANHWNYAGYISWHVHEMESSLPERMLT